MGKGNQSRRSKSVPPPETPRSSGAIASESSGRRHGKIRQVWGEVKDGVTKKMFKRSKHSPSVLPNADLEGSSSTPNIEDAPSASGVEQGADPRSALGDAHDAADQMNTLSGPARTVASAGQNASTALDNADTFRDTYIQPLRIFNSVIGTMADVHPYAKMALGVLSCASKIVLDQVDRDEAILGLLKKLGQVYDFMAQEDTLGQISTMHRIVGQISRQTLECAHFIRDYSETKNFWKRLGKNVIAETDTTIQQYRDVLDALMQNFRDQVARDVAIFVHRTGEILDLSGITYAEGAGLNTTKRCLPGTRTEMLSEIMGWINDTDDDVPRVLWLSGPAGTGKSAIAHTIASSFKDVGGLGSCYCFDREKSTENRHEKVFSTIARDLADRHPEMRRALADAVKNETALQKTEGVVQQWQKFIMEPLGKLSESTVGPVVIVIDALDESGAAKTRSDLLRILAGKLQDPAVPKITELPKNFRIVVTSRPLRDIYDEFSGAQHILRISMDNIPPATAQRDIHAYVSKKLAGLLHFGGKEFAALAKKADGMFEWGRLACEYIKAPPAGMSRRDSFNALVSLDPASREHLLYGMYHFILTEIMRQDAYGTAEFQQTRLVRFRSVMGQILGAAEPLPLNSLNAMRNHFPDKRDQYEVEIIVEHMGPLLSGTTDPSTPIRPLHASFRDFLTDQLCSGVFFVDVSKVHRDLGFASLRVMAHGLSFNICGIKSSYLPNSEDPDLRERVERCIPPHLSYACRFWAVHVRTQDFDIEVANEVKLFFDHERLLFWLEVLGLTNALSGAVLTLPPVAQWLKKHSAYKDTSLTAMDVQRFVQIFGSMIVHSTPHLYVSALPFAPVNSAISTKFTARFPKTLRVARGRDLHWAAAQSVLRGHTGFVTSVSFSPDGTRIATGSIDKTVRLWDAATGQPVGEPLRGHTDGVTSVSFSPDGTRIATGSEDKTARLWDTATGQPVGMPLEGHTHSVQSISFSPDGTRIATGSQDKTVRLWDTATGQPVGMPLEGHAHSVQSISFSPDGTRIATGSEDKIVRLWDTATGQPVGEPLQGHTDQVASVSFSPDGTRVVSASYDHTIRLWVAATGQPVGEPLRGHTSLVLSVSFSPDGMRIVTCSSDQTVRLWDAATGQPIGKPLLGHTNEIQSISFSPDGTRIVSGSCDHTARLWDAMMGQPVAEPLEGHTHSVQSVYFSPDRTRMVTTSDAKTFWLWDAATGQPVGEPLRGHTDKVDSVSFSPDGTRIATASRDETVRLWDAATGQPVGEPLQGHSVSFSPDGIRIATASEDGTVQLWDAVAGQPVGEPLRGHTDPVFSISFSPDGIHIATASSDGTVRLWDAVAGQPVGELLRGHTDPVFSVSFSPDGIRIATVSLDEIVRLWDTATGQPVGEPLPGHAVSFSPDGIRIATASWDGIVQLWDAATGQPVGDPLPGHSVSFSPDGIRIATISSDETVRLWDAATGQPVGEPLPGHSVWFSPDGTRIATASRDETVQLWDAATGQPVGELLQGHSVSFSPDRIRIATVSSDQIVRLWNAVTGQPVGEPFRGHTDQVKSLSFSPDGTCIVSHSRDHTVRAWYAAVGQPLQDCAEITSLDTSQITVPMEHSTVVSTHPWNNNFICFSSNSNHALSDAAELAVGTSLHDRRSTSFVLTADGWMMGPEGRLLFWVPPASRHPFYTPRTAFTIPRAPVELDLSCMAHGRHWQNCRAEPSLR